jgi:putative aldouronate transport system permease protein
MKVAQYFKKNSKGDVTLDVIKVVLLALVVIVTLYPFINILAISLNESTDTLRGGIYLWPRIFSLDSYVEIFENEAFMNALKITVLRTVIGTPIALFVQSSLAFVLSRKELFLRKAITILFVATMYFGGGVGTGGGFLIPGYMVVKGLGLLDSFWVFIFPLALNVYNVILIRSYMESLPESLVEAARIDGANDLRVYGQIIVPLSKPILLTVGLFIAVQQWNNWFDASIFTNDQALKPMQTVLVEILQQYSSGGSMTEQMSQAMSGRGVSPDSLRMAGTMITTIPIIMLYPLIQRYFVKGMLLGAVKD